jgi:SAM-dependent methyltransferase
MHLDVLDLRNFYYRETLGRNTQKAIRNELVKLWPNVKGQTVVGFGFAVPLLRPFLTEARRVIGLMPGPQGVMPWPSGGKNVAVLCEETLWPIETGQIDRLVVMHGLETSENPSALLDEIWRTLGPGGKVVFVVPNRAGVWSRSDKTPFGYGRPYSLGQLEAQLRRHEFVVEKAMSALYQPPSQSAMWRRVSGALEKLGHYLPFVTAGGVLIVEASKHLAAPTRPGLSERVSKPLHALEGIAGTAAESAREQS